MTSTQKQTNLDAVVIGAGFSGLYMLHRLREAGFLPVFTKLVRV